MTVYIKTPPRPLVTPLDRIAPHSIERCPTLVQLLRADVSIDVRELRACD